MNLRFLAVLAALGLAASESEKDCEDLLVAERVNIPRRRQPKGRRESDESVK